MDAVVVLPDHLHCLWRLPERDSDFSTRWRLIKHFFSSGQKQNTPIWQRRFWEHTIRDEEDWGRHVDYIHYNPVKHDLVSSPSEWEFSSFSRAVERGWYSAGWGAVEPVSIRGMHFE
jgi:putative transposase